MKRFSLFAWLLGLVCVVGCEPAKPVVKPDAPPADAAAPADGAAPADATPDKPAEEPAK